VIRSESEYQEALRRLTQDQKFAEEQRAALQARGLSREEIQRAMEPLLSFQAQLQDEVAWYERVRRRDFGTISNLTEIGRLLIALRIANGLTQRELADRLGVSEAQVSRDERNEYHGVSVERAQRVLDALNEKVTAGVQERQLTGPPPGLATV
jgi:DNA-directed RNA polymerase specialized sigma subunit